MRLIENEHEAELKLKNEKFNEILRQNQRDIEEKINIISKLNEKIAKLEKSIAGNESNIKNYKDENQYLSDAVTKLRTKLDERELEKDQLTKKLNELEENYQEKSKLENFSNQLKNELYKKNYELSAKFKQEVASREELRDTSKTLEKQLEDTINLLINREKEIMKNKQIIDEFKEKLEISRKGTVNAQKEFDGLLRNIYDAFQTNDKKNILIAIKDIYKNYVLNDSKKFYEAGKININVRIELEKQIEYLQNELDYKKEVSIKKGKEQVIEYRKKMEENALLIQEMSKIKKLNAEMSNQIKNLKYKNVTLTQTIERFKNTKRYKFFDKFEKEKDNLPNNISTMVNNQSNFNFPSSYSQQNSNISVINNGILMANNSSESTLPSDALPIINNSQPQPPSKGSLRNMKNRIYKPWDKKTLTQEKLLKFNEMKRIIEGKNDLIQRLITENDFLKKNFAMNNKSKSP
jgi:chromosome segregation ATPase